MMLLFENGQRSEAVLLAASDYRMRVVVQGVDDATELLLIKDQWMSEEGEVVDIESLILAGQAFGRPVARGHAA
jgi:hypothetical protein